MIKFGNFGDCDSGVKGTGSGRCDIASFGDPRGIVLFQKRFEFDVTTDTLDEATYKLNVQDLNLFPLTEIYNFEQPTPENEKNTSSTGILTEIRAGKPQFTFMYDKGSCFHKALYDKRGKNRWDLGILFDTGILLARNEAGTKVSGFDMGMFSVETFKFVQGTDPEMSTAMMQLVDADQFNRLHEFFSFEALGFNANRIDGVIEGALSYSTAPVAGTSIEVLLTGDCNTDEFIDGLDDGSNWRLGGAQAAATAISSVAYNASTGVYTITTDVALASGDTVQVELFDGTNSRASVVDADGNMYKAIAPLVTIP